MDSLRIDCGTCQARGPACSECMMTALLGPIDEVVEFDSDEAGALRQMTRLGLLPPLRLVRPVSGDPLSSSDDAGGFAWDAEAL